MKEKILNIARIVVLSFILSTAIGYSLADWAPPVGAPPFNNTPPPINVGPAPQARDGMLFINNRLFATKAETQSTVASDSGTTLTTKDYVDGMAGALRFIDGFSCAACPYGSYVSYTSGGGWVPRSCSFKTENGTIKSPVSTGAFTDPTQNPQRQCHLDVTSTGASTDYVFGFWTY